MPSYLRGTDWVSSTATDQNPNNLNTANPNFKELNGAQNNPAYDAWNRYGDENNNAVTIQESELQWQRTHIHSPQNGLLGERPR